MKYIAHTLFKGISVCGDVIDIPEKAISDDSGKLIIYNSKAVCYNTSHIAHQYFAINEDGQGILRGKLTQAIDKLLSTVDSDTDIRTEKLCCDPVCLSLRRTEHPETWLWKHEFYEADIGTLIYIAKLIGVKESEYSV